jgi:hypothetical protein
MSTKLGEARENAWGPKTKSPNFDGEIKVVGRERADLQPRVAEDDDRCPWSAR